MRLHPDLLPSHHATSLQERFSRAAAHYDEAAVLAREVGQRMAARLDYIKLAPRCFADIGCATGDGLRALQQRYPQALPLAIDLAPGMLQRVRAAARPTGFMPRLRQLLGPAGQAGGGAAAQLINADVNALPLSYGSVDFIWSNLMLHWLDDPLPALRELHHVLRVDGLLMFAMLGPDTLKELRAACLACGVAPPLRRFHDMHDIGDMLLAAGFADPVMDMEMLAISYGGAHPVRSLLRDQRWLGVRNALLGELSWRDWRRVFRHYAAQRSEAGLPASFEIIHGHAWKPEPRTDAAGHAIVRFGKPGAAR